MNIDVNALLVINVANMMVLALTVPLMMGQRLSPAAGAARASLIINALGWICMIASNSWPEQWQDRLLSTLAIAGYSGSNWLFYRALTAWLGPRPLPRAMALLAVLLPLGYAVLFPSYALRVGWANFLLAVQLLITFRAALHSRTELQGGWRWAIAISTALMALLTAGRGYLGAFTADYPSFLTPHPWNIAAMLWANVYLVLINVAILVGWREEAELALRQAAVTDPLTGVRNRRGWYELAQPLVAQANRHDQPLALIMLDLDFFKKLNDTHGHAVGDLALKLFARLLLSTRRTSDVAARIGGEEFCLLLPMADEAAAHNFDQRLRQRLAQEAATALPVSLTFSSGLAMLRRPEETLELLMARADAALYEAKHAGRNQLAVSG